MTISATSTINPQRNNGHHVLAMAGGAVLGNAVRYVLPTKSEFSSIVNKDAVDTFVSSAKMNARGSERSILKYGGVGALVALGASLLSKFMPENKNKNNSAIEYTKLGALVDAPDYAVEMVWYTDSQV